MVLQKKENTSTGGGPNKKILFSPLEEDVIDLISLRQCATGLENSFSFGLSSNTPLCELEPHDDANADENGNVVIDDTGRREEQEENTVRRKRRLETSETSDDFRNKTFKLVENQTVAQTQFNEQIVTAVETLSSSMDKSHASVKEMHNTLYKIYKEQQSSNTLMKKYLEETLRHNKEVESLIMKKLILKQKILEMQVQSINEMN